MKRFLPVFIAVLGTLGTTIAQTSLEFVSGKVEFKIKNMGMPVNGTMTGASMQFKQTSVDPATWSFEGTVSPATISTGIDLRDKHLKRSDYFDIAQYPVISLRSPGIIAKGKNNYEGVFNLTIKGITKSVIIPFTIRKDDKSMAVEGTFTINRLDYGLGEESIILSDNVVISVSAAFKVLKLLQ
jgi:polyisoprenoid-binding protein YceI